MPRTLSCGLAAAALAVSCLAATAPGSARADDRDLGRMSDYVRLGTSDDSGQFVKNRWLVQVKGPSIAQGSTATSVGNSQKAVVQAAARAGVKIRGQRSFSRTFNGMAVTLDAKQVRKLMRVPGVTGIYPVVAVSRPVTDGGTTDPSMANAVGLSGAAIARDDLGYDGAGIKVGVIDSGIDIDHPDFGGTGTNGTTAFPTSRVKYGFDFVGDDYNAKLEDSVPVPDANPDDCGGHGTHVAGIIGADGDTANKGVKGVAPKVTFGAYRVFGCEGSTSSEIIMAAMERAEADGMDVVNMSLGASMMTWPDYPTAQASDAMARRGTVMVASAGNSGEDGAFSSGAPGVGKDTLAVASFDNSHLTQRAIRANGQLYGYGHADDSPLPPRSGSMKLVPLGQPGSPEAGGCDEYTDAQKALFADGAAALVQRGTCTFYQKVINAQHAGAQAVVLYNNAPGTLSPGLEGDEKITIPVIMLSQADGTALATAEDPTIEWTDETIESKDPAGGRISDFSSWGLAATLDLKPELGAPGGNIWSTYPLEKGAHKSLSGTSMAAPHTAGAVAQLLQARPALKGRPAQVRTLLMNTARHDALWSMDPEMGLVEPVIRQGAGMIQVDRAIATQQRVTPSKISLGEQQAAPVTTTLTLRNDAARPVVYELTHETSIGTLGTSDPAFDLLDAQVELPSRVVVPPRSTKKVKVSIQAPADAPNGYVYGGWIVAKSATGATLNVPYTGMAGDYQRVDVLNAAGSDASCLGELVDGTPRCLDEQTGRSYTMADGDQPVAVFRIEYPVEVFQILVHKANADGSKGELLGTVLETEKEGRIVGDVGVPWDGTYLTTGSSPYLAKASAGDYVLEVRALRALGDAAVEADWQTWTSDAFTATFTGGEPAVDAARVNDPGVLRTARA